jgi:site-specific recombinase XerD
MTAPRPRTRQPKQLDAGMLQTEISSFRLHLAAGNKSAKTIRTYTEAVQWFAAAHLLGQASRASWEQVDGRDIQRWMTWLQDRYSSAYASNQYRALQQFFRWLAAEDELPDPMAGLPPPTVPHKLVPVFTGEELATLERACAGRTFAQRRDTAIIAVFKATGIRLSELADICYHPGDPQRSDVDLWQREITIRGKGGKDRIVRIGHQAARSLDRYIRARSRHAQAWKPQLWLGMNCCTCGGELSTSTRPKSPSADQLRLYAANGSRGPPREADPAWSASTAKPWRSCGSISASKPKSGKPPGQPGPTMTAWCSPPSGANRSTPTP